MWSCPPLQCDHIVHLPRNRRGHKRVPIKNRVEEALRVEYVGGLSRVKLAWLQISVYEEHCKAMVEFKRESSRGGQGGPQVTSTPSGSGNAFCVSLSLGLQG